MKPVFLSIIGLLVWVGCAMAQTDDEEARALALTLDCYSAAESFGAMQRCVFHASQDCLIPANIPMTSRPHFMVVMGCYSAETSAWTGLLNNELAQTRALFVELDAKRLAWLKRADAEELYAQEPTFLGSLEKAQAAWHAFVDAECQVSGRGDQLSDQPFVPPYGCRLEMTAERTIALWKMRRSRLIEKLKYLDE